MSPHREYLHGGLTMLYLYDQSQIEIDAKAVLIREILTKAKNKSNLYHREAQYADAIRKHQYWAEKDPLFYTHLASWYAKNGSLRDHQELFCVVLLSSKLPVMQNAGFYLLQSLRTYQVAKVLKLSKSWPFRVSRQLIRAITFWIRRRENTPSWLEECALRDRHSLKTLYASLHIKPSAQAQSILFDEDKNQSSRFSALKKLARSSNPQEICQIIRNAQIPFTTAIGAIKKPTKEVWIALIDVMTAQQITNHLIAFRRKGLLADQEVSKLIQDKLNNAKEMARASQIKKAVATRALGDEGNQTEVILKSMREQLTKKGPIKDKTAIFIDKSGSMEKAIELGRLLALACTFAMTEPPTVLAFDGSVYKVDVNKKQSDREITGKFEMIRASGSTSIGSPFKHLFEHRIKVDQIILISDGEHNQAPSPIDMAMRYLKEINTKTHLVFIEIQKTAGISVSNITEGLEAQFKNQLTILPFSGDYYGIDTIITMLNREGRNSVVDTVMATKIPDLDNLRDLPAGYDEENQEIK